MSNISERGQQLSSSQQVLLALKEARARLEAIEKSRTEPIAIIGMGCRFPGGANDPTTFWQLLRDGVDAITEVPPDRWDIDAYYDPDPEAPGKMYTRYGGFLQQVDQFDPQFFGISPREAVGMDPQQRLLLEVSWEALENAGQTPRELRCSQTGVFMGICTDDYAQVSLNFGDLTSIDAYSSLGNTRSIAVGRIAYTLGLQGPNIQLDTACSSSLVTVHLAIQSLRSGECNLALAGGVNLILSPIGTINRSKLKALSPDGRCKTFDASANGYAQGEGCGVVVLKRLSDAVANGDNILALIQGSAVNHDGPSSGLTVPNELAQEKVIRQALKNAKVEPAFVSYVEAHGTGTSLGDPIEIGALGAVFGKELTKNQPLAIGSVKTNFGHLEAAAGIGCLIKVVLALQHKEIPPSLHFKQPNPHIPWDELPIVVPTSRMSWTSESKRRIAGVSSFGISGTNAHVVLEEAPATEPVPESVERPLHLLTLSAKTQEALKQLAERYENHLAANPTLALGDICFSANTGRSHFHHRLSAIATSTAELREKLAAFTAGQEATGVFGGQVSDITQVMVAFLFTGQGSQYVGMGRQLYETQPTFRRTLDRCDEILRPYLEQPLLEVLYPKPGMSSPLDETAYTQPALFALEYALAELWRSWGITPDVVMGHSVGEYVAACVAGVFSLEDGLKLIASRARLMQALPPDGEMVAVKASEAQVKAAIQPYAQKVAIAASNGPESLVISGQHQAIGAVCATLEAAGVKTKPLQVSHAFHSPLMEPMLAAFERVATSVTYSSPRIGLISNVTGGLVTTEVATPQYWCRHVRQPVRFATGMQTLQQQGYEVLVEIGPKPQLLGMGRHCLSEVETGHFAFLPSLRPGQSDWQQLLQSLAELYVRGVPVDWSEFDRDYPRHRVVLPTYPFQRQRYWVETTEVHYQKTDKLSRNGFQSKRPHPLLGQRLHSALKEIQFESQISQDSPAFLKHHCIYQTVILPATAYLEMAVSAGAAVFKSDNLVLEEVVIQQALILPKDEAKTLQLILIPEATNAYSFQIFSLTTDEEDLEPSWTLHASGKVLVEDKDPRPPQADLASLQAEYIEEISLEAYYQQFRDRGIDYGPSFQALEQLWRHEGKVLGQISLPEALVGEAGNYRLHPVLLDACFQVLGAISTNDGKQDAYLPVGLERLRVYGHPSTRLWSQTQMLQVKGANQNILTADLNLLDETGTVVAQLEGLSVTRASRKALLRSLQKDLGNWLYQIAWHPQDRNPNQLPLHIEKPSSWLIFADNGGIGLKLANRLKERGDRCVLVSAGPAYENSKGEHYQINPTEPLDFQRLFQEIVGNHQPPYRGIVHLWSLAETLGNETTINALQDVQALGCGSVLHLVQTLASAGWSELPRLWLVTRGSQPVGAAPAPLQVQQATLWGLGRVIALEHPDLHSVCLDLEPSPAQDEIPALLEELWSPDREDQVSYRQGVRHVARLVQHQSHSLGSRGQLQETVSEPFQLKISELGILENLTLVPMTRRQPGPGEVEIQVRATGLNFRDVLNALGMLQEYSEQLGIDSGASRVRGFPPLSELASADLPFGGECAGKIVAVGENVTDLKVGDEVIAAQALGSFSSFVIVRAEFVVPKPQELSFEEAATIPVTFLTAYYGLHHLAKVQPGERVLIHAAAGGVGQAAVQLAQRAGAQVLATASPSKWEFLKSMGVEQVMNSRTLDFAEEVMAITKGQGVNIVLNSLNGEFIAKSFEVLGQGGRFIEIGKIGIWDQRQVQEFRPDISYFPFDLLEVSVHNPSLIAAMLRELMQAFRQGTLKPLPRKEFPIQDVVSAFRYMAQAKHIGKVVVSQPELAMGVDVSDRKPVRSDSSYLITGGLGALGLKVAHWMVEQGARHLILTGRRGASGVVQEAVSQLEQAGAQVLVAQADVSKQEDVAKVLEQGRASMPPLRGIVHAAGVLDDGVLLGQNWERFTRVMTPKVEGTWNLHVLTQDMALDFFVCFSSAASLLGSPGQGNYAAANAFMDAVAHHRRALGLPGLSINWGPWAEAGMAAELGSRNKRRIADLGLETIAPEQGLQVLAELLTTGAVQVGVVPVNLPTFIQQFPLGAYPAFISELAHQVGQQVKGEQPQAKPLEILRQLEESSPGLRHSFLIAHIQEQVAKALGLSASQLDVQLPLNNMGLDSLMAVDLRNRIKTELGVDVPIVQFMEGFSVASLATQVSEQLTEAQSTSSTSIRTPPTPSKGEQKAARMDISKGVHADNGGRLSRRAISDGDWIEGEI